MGSHVAMPSVNKGGLEWFCLNVYGSQVTFALLVIRNFVGISRSSRTLVCLFLFLFV